MITNTHCFDLARRPNQKILVACRNSIGFSIWKPCLSVKRQYVNTDRIFQNLCAVEYERKKSDLKYFYNTNWPIQKLRYLAECLLSSTARE
jgi:hypothetical protein